MSGDLRLTCVNCHAELYAQWWSARQRAYECRRCGALNPGWMTGASATDPARQDAPTSGTSTSGVPTAWVPPPQRRRGIAGPIGAAGLAAVVVLVSQGTPALALIIGVLVFAFVWWQRESADRLSELEARIASLASQRSVPAESAAPTLAAEPTPPAPTAAAVANVVAGLSEPDRPVIAPPAAVPPTPAAPQPPPAPSAFDVAVARLRSSSAAELEELVAGRVLPIVGGVALVAAAIFFLGLAFARGWIGEEGRVLIGLVAGTATYGIGAALLFRGQALIGHILVGVGLGVVSLALFGATQLYGLVPAEIGIFAALVVDLTAAVLAVRVKSMVVAGLGLVTVLVAPPLTGASPTLITVLFLGVALVATTAISIFQSWRWLPGLAFILTAPQLAAYASDGPDPLQAVPVLLGFGVLNAVAAIGEEWRVLRRELSPSSATLLAGSAGFVIWAVLTVTSGDHAAWQGLLVAAVGAGHLGLGLGFLVRGGDRHPFGMLATGIGIAAVTMAVPLQWGGAPVPMIWAAEAMALTWVYVTRRHALAGLGAAAIGLLAVGHLVAIEYPLGNLIAGTGWTKVPASIPYLDPAGLALAWTVAMAGAALAMLRTNIERSFVAAGLLLTIAWTLPHEFAGVTLVWTFGLLAVVSAAARWRWIRVTPEEAFPLVWRAKLIAPHALELVVAVTGIAAYALTLWILRPGQLPALATGSAALPWPPFTDAGTAMVLGLVISALACGRIADASPWRPGAVILATATVAYLLPFELPLAWVVVGWCALAAGLMAGNRWLGRHPAIGLAGDILGGMAIVLWLAAVLPPIVLLAGMDLQPPIVNEGTLGGVAVIGLLMLRYRLAADPRQQLGLAAGAGVVAVYLVSVAVIDVVEQVASGTVSEADLRYLGQVALSVCWAVLGLGTLVGGLIIRSLPVRLFGLALLGVATVKVFVVDLAAVDIAFRVLSFVGLGLLLIGAGWIYLRLEGRTRERPAAEADADR